jgi:hypothetical protein
MIFVNYFEDHCNLAKAADVYILEVAHETASCEFQRSAWISPQWRFRDMLATSNRQNGRACRAACYGQVQTASVLAVRSGKTAVDFSIAVLLNSGVRRRSALPH